MDLLQEPNVQDLARLIQDGLDDSRQTIAEMKAASAEAEPQPEAPELMQTPG